MINNKDLIIDRLKAHLQYAKTHGINEDSILGISKKTGISRSNLYAIFSGEQQPQLSTALKIIKELGYTVQVA